MTADPRAGALAGKILGLPVRCDPNLPPGFYRARYEGPKLTELRAFGAQPIPAGCSSLDVSEEDFLRLTAVAALEAEEPA